MNIDVAILVAMITGGAGVIATWLTMRAQVKGAEAALICGYTKLVNDLRIEIDRLTEKQAVIERQVAMLQGIVQERDKHIERLTCAMGNILSLATRNAGAS